MRREPSNTKQIGTATHAHKTTSTPPPAVAHVHTAALHTTTDSLLALEPRVMFDAAALLTGTEVSQDADPAHPTDAELSDTEHEQAEAAAVQGDSLREVVDAFGWPAERRELVFIDTSVDEYHTLMADITPNAEIILLDSTRDGIEQIAAILQDDTDIDAIHLLSHGKQGALRVGTGTLTIESMANEYAEALSSIRQALSAEADILIYGCRFGEGQVGQHAVTRLAQLTGADIAASQDLTGDTALGGDWELEYQTGSIETAIVVNEEAQHEFASVLGPTPPTIANLGGETLAYTEGDGAQLIDQSSNAAVTDVDNSDFETGTLTVSFTAGSDSTEDVLAIQHQGPGAGQIGIAGATVTYEGTTIGTVAGGSGGANLVITLDSDATPTAVSALVQNITYENTDTDDPTTGNRTVRYVLTDGDGGTSANYDTTVTVTAVNDTPVNIVPGAQIANEDTPLVISGISVTDGDDTLLTVQLAVTNGTLNVTLNGATISAGANDTNTLTLSGTQTNINATLASLKYQGSLEFVGADTLTVTSTDSNTAQDVDTIGITVLRDTDGDGVSDIRDIDDDNDGILDLHERNTDGVNLIINTSFEASDGTSDAAPVLSGNNTAITLPGWTIIGDIDIGDATVFGSPDAVAFASGEQLVDLLGNAPTEVGGTQPGMILADQTGYVPNGIEQTLTTTAGEEYRFDFDYTGHEPDGQGANMFINGELVAEIIYTDATAFVSNTFTTTFIGTGSDTITLIASRSARQNGGLLIDNFSVQKFVNRDTDTDGVANHLDIDSDNDGITDTVEAQTSDGYIAPSGMPTSMTDIDEDGLDDNFDTNTSSVETNKSLGLTPVDTDGDFIPDIIDANSDNDGFNDILERRDGQATSISSTVDSDNDGLLDIFEGNAVNDGFDTNDENLHAFNGNFSLGDHDNDTTADGTGAIPLTADFDFRDVNRVPVITNLGGDTLAYTESDGAQVIDQSSNAAVTDVDSSNFDTGTLTVSFTAGSDSAEDVLSIRDQGPGTSNITVTGNTVSYGGTQIGTVAGGSGGTNLVITLDSDANATAVSALLNNITYKNTDTENPTTTSRTVRYSLTDGDGGTSANYDTTVTVSAVNDAPTFKRGDGIVVTDIPGTSDSGESLIIQADGKILVAGNSVNGGARNFALTRYNTDGTLDTTFGAGDGIVTTAIGTGEISGFSIALQSDGKILVSGYANVGSTNDFAVARYLADGTLDTSFGGNGIVTTAIGTADDNSWSVAVQPDNKVLVSGYAKIGTTNNFAVVRYLSDGTLDTSFGGDGIVTTAIGTEGNSGYNMALQSDGKILVSGLVKIGSSKDFAIVRYLADGTLDTSFGGDGIVTTAIGTGTDRSWSVTVQPDNKILLSGDAKIGTTRDIAVVRYLADGTLDTSFGGDGIVTTAIGTGQDSGLDVTVQLDGKILVAGYSSNGTDHDFAMTRYNIDGTLDTSFGGGDGIVTTAIGTGDDYGHSIRIQSDGKILIVGTTIDGSNRFALVRYHTDGTLDTSFDHNILNGRPTFTEGGSAVILDVDVTLNDRELDALNGGTGNYSGASLTLARNGGANADDVLSFTDANGLSLSGSTLLKNSQIIASFDTTTSPGQLVITWTDANGEIPTSADVTAILRQLTYANSSETPPASAQIDWTFTDGNTGSQGTGGALTDSGSMTVTITAVNDVPVIDNLDGDTLAYTKSDGAVVIDQSSNATVIDVDSTNFETGTLTVSFTAGSDSTEDLLAIRHQGADAGQIGVSGPNVTYAGTMIGTVTGGTSGTNLVITFNSNAEATAVSALLNNITYENTDTENPTTSPRTVRYRLTDGDGGTSATHDVLITVANPNSAPTITSNGGGALAHITVAESTTAVTTVTATDPDLPGDTFTYQLVGGADASHFVINSRTGALAFTTTPDFETPHDTNADNQYHVQVQVDDGHGGTDLQTMVVEVTNTIEPLPPMPEPEPEPKPETETEGEAEGDSTTKDKQTTTTTSPTTTPPPPGPLSPVVLTQGPTPQDHPTDKSATAARVGREFDHQLAALSPRQVRDLTSAHRLGLSDTLSAPMRTFDLPYAAPRVSLELELQLEALASHLHGTIQQDQLDSQIMSGVTAGTGLTLSAGYVAWILRGTTILTSLFTSLPAWIHFDPLPILTGGYTAHKTGQETNGAAIDQENKEHQGLDEIFHDSDQD